MIPGNLFTPEPDVSGFEPPLDLPYRPLTQVVQGGIALNNPSQGRQFQQWQVSYANDTISVQPVAQPVVFTLPVTGALAVSLAFDNNMGVVLNWQTINSSVIYYYDTLTAAYNTLTVPGTTSSRICVDDARTFYTAQSDVMFAYTRAGNLCYRQQRDRYQVEYVIGPTTKKLFKVGQSLINRLQFMLI